MNFSLIARQTNITLTMLFNLRRRMLESGFETVRADDSLYLGSPTFRWLAAAMRGMLDTRADGFAGSIKIPVLILAAARDRIVSTPAIESLGLRLRTGRHMVIANGRHELFMETNAIRGQVLAAFDAFITDQSS